MTIHRIPRLTLAGTGSGCGKTTVTAALLRAFGDLGLVVQPFKAGPDYLDPMIHQAATGRASANLDSWLLDPETIRSLFRRRVQATDAGLALIEGVMGLYDGLDDTLAGSTASVADILETPIILLVDGRGLSLSACAIIQGYQRFHASTGRRIAGVILNRVSGSTAAHLGAMIARHCGLPVVGSMPVRQDCQLESRHLGLVPAPEDPGLEAKIRKLADQARESIDLPALLKLAESAGEMPEALLPGEPACPADCGLRIGVARDPAFNFYYADNFDLLRRLGAELVFFSPLADPCLPDELDGLYLGGGYPEVFAARLSANATLRRQIREQVSAGLPTVAECGGFLYLAEKLQDQLGQEHEMCGVVPTRATMTNQLQRFGYQTLTMAKDGLLGQAGDQVRAHEFHYSACGDYGQDCQVAKPGGRTWRAVHHGKSAWIGYPHLHFGSQPALAVNWLRQCRNWRSQRQEAGNTHTGDDPGGPNT